MLPTINQSINERRTFRCLSNEWTAVDMVRGVLGAFETVGVVLVEPFGEHLQADESAMSSMLIGRTTTHLRPTARRRAQVDASGDAWRHV